MSLLLIKITIKVQLRCLRDSLYKFNNINLIIFKVTSHIVLIEVTKSETVLTEVQISQVCIGYNKYLILEIFF